jgi:hypothetical protein
LALLVALAVASIVFMLRRPAGSGARERVITG